MAVAMNSGYVISGRALWFIIVRVDDDVSEIM